MSSQVALPMIVIALAFVAALTLLDVIVWSRTRRRAEHYERQNIGLRAAVDVLRDSTETARQVFAAYAEHHEAKGTSEGRDKAARNRRMASVMAIGLQITNQEQDA